LAISPLPAAAERAFFLREMRKTATARISHGGGHATSAGACAPSSPERPIPVSPTPSPSSTFCSIAFRRLPATLALLVGTLAMGCAPKALVPAASPSSGSAEASIPDGPLPYAADYPTARSLARAPAGRRWSNVATPLDGTWALLLNAEARQAWEQYVALPPAARDREAFVRTMVQTQPLCQTQLQCTAEARARTSFALQGWYDGIALVEWRGELWASSPKASADCAARVAELRRDAAVAPMLAGVVCGAGKRGLDEAEENASAVGFHRFTRDAQLGAVEARR